MKDCILVTGGAGFIGCAIANRLAPSGLPVVAFDNLHPQIHPERRRPAALPPEVDLVEGDVSSAADWQRLLARYRPRKVYHLAAETGTGQSLTESSRHAEVNVLGTARMLDALAAHDAMPERIVLSSSRAVYGEGEWQRSDGSRFSPPQRDLAMLERNEWDYPGSNALPVSAETTEPRPVSVYGATKLAQEHIVRAWANAFGVGVAVARLQNVYGPGQALGNPYTGIVPLFAQLARRGESIPLYEDGRMLRDFVYIEDVADALVSLMETGTAPREAVDIGTGHSISIAELASIVAAHYRAPAPHVCGKYRHGDVRHAACNSARAQAFLDWAPRVAPVQGISTLCNWIDGLDVGGTS
jgi:dTDP-L-rhamnose 4-epimerase